MATQLAVQSEQPPQRAPSIVDTVASRYGMAGARFVQALRATVVPNECDDAQLAAFLVVCNEYQLNPLTKEIYAFPSKGRVTPMVSIDGWVSLINRHPMMDGMDFLDIPDASGKLMAIECTIYRKDRSRPIKVIEYLAECKGTTGPWQKSPARMLRHRALIQAGRYAFGFSGVSIEGHDVIDGGMIEPELRDATPPRRVVAPSPDNAKADADKAVDALFYDDEPESEQHTSDATPAEPDEARTDAEAFTARSIKSVAAAKDTEALAALQTKRADMWAELRAAYPDLADQVDAAIKDRLATFEGAE